MKGGFWLLLRLNHFYFFTKRLQNERLYGLLLHEIRRNPWSGDAFADFSGDKHPFRLGGTTIRDQDLFGHN